MERKYLTGAKKSHPRTIQGKTALDVVKGPLPFLLEPLSQFLGHCFPWVVLLTCSDRHDRRRQHKCPLNVCIGRLWRNGVFHAPSRRMVSHTQKQRAWFSGCHFCESSEHYVIVILISSLVKMKIN